MRAPANQILQYSRRVGGHSFAMMATQQADARKPAHGNFIGGNENQ
jgi:hypothetical protein